MPVVEFDKVTFAYGDRPVLSDVSFAIEQGELVALVGDNGSGKSTIAKIIDGFLAPDAGGVRVLGHDVARIAGTDDVFALRRDTGFVFQNPDDQFTASLVLDEVAFGPRNLGLAREDVLARVGDAFDAVGMADAIGRDVNTLSGGQKQRIAIADALAMRPHLLILDEPTSMLDADGRREVMGIARHLCADGMAVLLVTHDASEAACADRILQLRDGRVREVKAESADERAHSFENASPSASVEVPLGSLAEPSTEPIITFEAVSFTYDDRMQLSAGGISVFGESQEGRLALDGVDLEIYPGQLVAVTGPNGSGKTTLIQHMNGLLKPTSGCVCVAGISTSTRQGANAARRVVGVGFQYPERSLFAQTVFDEVAFGPRNLGLTEEGVRECVQKALADVALSDACAEKSPFELSGGEQRKVAIAGVLAMRPQVIVLDEPFANMDAATHAHFVALFKHLRSEGKTVVIVTHESHDARLFDRIIHVHAGRVTAIA